MGTKEWGRCLDKGQRAWAMKGVNPPSGQRETGPSPGEGERDWEKELD